MGQGRYDAAVIGAGMGGMCATALLTHAGYKVLLVEKLPQLGGRCSTIEYKGYKIPHVAQEQPLYGPPAMVWREVGAEFDVAPQDPIVYRIKGQDYELPPKGQFGAALRACCKDEAEFDRIRNALRRAATWLEPSSSLTFRDWLFQYTDNETLLALFDNLWGALVIVRMHEVPAKDVIGFYRLGLREWSVATRPRRGNLALMESLAKVIRAKGGQIWTRSAVKRILTTGGEVKGIGVDKEGAEVEVMAKAVISNTGPIKTMELVGEEKLDRGYVKELKENIRPGCLILISFAADKPLIKYTGGLGPVGSRVVVNISCLSYTCEVAPPGKYFHTAEVMPTTEIGPLDLNKEVEFAMEDLRENIPNFEKDAELLHIGCFPGNWPGHRNLMGYDPPQKTPIENLYNVGDGVLPYGQCGTPGSAISARIVVEDIKTRFKPTEA